VKEYKELPINEIGNKAYNLKILEENKLNVPKWMVLPNKFLNSFNETSNIADFMTFIEKEFTGIHNFAVRTSSSKEDSENYSFAGQFDTYLNIGKEELVETIKRVIDDLKNKELNLYSKEDKENSIGIIIQEMINPEKSGVVFTANPQGILNETVIVVGKGLGENVVLDKEYTTTYYYNLTDDLYYYSRQADAEVLTNAEVVEIIRISKKVKEIYNGDMDIEWCIKDGVLYILQARPITTFNKRDVIILDNSNIVESYPYITLPLTASYVKEAYYRVFYKCFERMMGKDIIKDYDDVLKDMVESVNGRMYYRISNWYTLIKLLPFGDKIIPIWQEMLGVSNKEVKIKEIKRKNVFTIFYALKYFINNNKNMKKLDLEFIKMIDYYNSNYNKDLSNKELVELFTYLIDNLSKNWDITLINDMYAFIFTYLLNNKVKKVYPEDYKIITNNLITQKADIDSMKPIKELIKISQYVKENSKILEELKTIKDDTEFYYYMKSKPEFKNIIDNYLQEYGDRSLEELKLESKTFRSSPILLLKEIIKYADNNIVISGLNKDDKIELKQTIGMKWLIKHASLGIKNRESSRLNRSRIFGMIRNIFNSISANLYKNNDVESIEDIYYLKYEEIVNYIMNGKFDIKEIIRSRKKEYENYALLPTYSRLIFDGAIFNKTQVDVEVNLNLENCSKLQGVPCAGEEVIGEVLVVNDPKIVEDSRDKILVTKMTDPGWVFLLCTAKGVISEKGSILSHTAIISRELNIVAVVGVKNAINLLQTGDKIKINGKTGEIEILERAETLCIK